MLRSLVSQLLGSRSEAAAQYRSAIDAERAGDPDAAIEHYRRALRSGPGHAAAWNDLGRLLCARREFPAAREAFENALAADPELAVALANLAQLLHHEFREFGEAEALWRRVLDLDPERGDALAGLGLALQEQGFATEAAALFRRAIALDPGDADAHEWLLFSLNLLPDADPREVFAEHRRWAARLASDVARPHRAARRPGAAERIRVGLVSGDFRAHATAAFLLPLARGLDRGRFELWFFPTLHAQDPVEPMFRALASAWHPLADLSDEAAAERIRGLGIDVLIDLSGHTLGGRLGVFALRPAPVAAAWLGYLNTSGLEAIDWRITDARADPPGASEVWHSERLLRLPRTQWCFEPSPDAPEPRVRDPGEVRFASCNHIAKLNAQVLALWGRLLALQPRTTLALLGVPEGRARERISAALGAQGVTPDRIEFSGRLPPRRYWEMIDRMDIALDPFPYNGGASTCETLWMGLPVVTLAGRFGFARSGASILGTLGLSDLVAESEHDYLRIARDLAADAARRAALRATLRQRMRASALLDAAGFARDFGDALVGMVERRAC